MTAATYTPLHSITFYDFPAIPELSSNPSTNIHKAPLSLNYEPTQFN